MGRYHWHDIGDYLSQAEKLEKISTFASIAGITAANAWQSVTPDEHGDWLKQRDPSFQRFIAIAKDERAVFASFASGVKTGRDAWCYNCSRSTVKEKMGSMMAFLNSEIARYERSGRAVAADAFINPIQL